jgi:hypothetical protein
VRGKALGQALHWSAPQVFGTRAKFITTTEPAYLELTVIYENRELHSPFAQGGTSVDGKIKSLFFVLLSFFAFHIAIL